MTEDKRFDINSGTWKVVKEWAIARKKQLTLDLVEKEFETIGQVQDVQGSIRELNNLLNLSCKTEPPPPWDAQGGIGYDR